MSSQTARRGASRVDGGSRWRACGVSRAASSLARERVEEIGVGSGVVAELPVDALGRRGHEQTVACCLDAGRRKLGR
jgi:hypothetical protein